MKRLTLEERIKEIGKITPAERPEIVRMLGYEYPATAHDAINKAVKKFNGWAK